ncbi:DUF1232 domain-containing protein [Thermocrinis sp.]
MEDRLSRYCKEIQTSELRRLVEDKLSKISPTMEHVRNLILDVKLLLRILLDEEFDLKEEARRDFVCALLYFVERKDKILDSIPFIGLWDDYKVVRFVREKHKEEIKRYLETVPYFVANYF